MPSRIDRIMRYAFPVIVILLGVTYYFVNPSSHTHYIKCPWYICTGTSCPACGSQRALHALTHGHLLEALRYNYFFVISIPYALVAVLVSWYNVNHRLDRLKELAFHRYTLYGYVVLFCAWWVVRNILHI